MGEREREEGRGQEPRGGRERECEVGAGDRRAARSSTSIFSRVVHRNTMICLSLMIPFFAFVLCKLQAYRPLMFGMPCICPAGQPTSRGHRITYTYRVRNSETLTGLWNNASG